MLPLFPLLQRHQGWPSPPPLLLTALGPSLLLMLFLKSMLGKPVMGRAVEGAGIVEWTDRDAHKE